MNPGEALEALLGNADILRVEDQDYLLAPVSSALLDSLATVGADVNDLEPDDPPEDDDPGEDSDPPEKSAAEEGPSHRPNAWDRQNYVAMRERLFEKQGDVYLTIIPGRDIRIQHQGAFR